jgi:hypothetical protein
VELGGHPPSRVVLGHLSGDHNSPRRALETVGAVLAGAGIILELSVAPRDRATTRFEIG